MTVALTVGQRLAHVRRHTGALWQRLERPARACLLVLIVGLLIRDLGVVGWRAVWQNLPIAPLFYLIFFINYCSLPLFEGLIYNLVWKTGYAIMPVLIRKRVFNEAVIDYSGETVLYAWARTHTRLEPRAIVSTVRDVNVLSAIAGNLATCLILVAVIALQADKLAAADAQLLRRGALFTGGSVLALMAVAALFRKWLLTLPLGQCVAVGALHLLRLGTFLVLQALQWHVAVPAVAWQNWVTFLALQMAISRLPLLPAKDLFFAGLAINLGARMALAPGVVGGLFAAASGLNLVAHAVMYALAHLLARDGKK
ncbi:hypothetical protein [Novosphingobium acidiphilum]|uniref:hypothetical protein n=1 Tax=Novosphingobium acidiphilum TaxID=505248 RepID=UPI0012EBEA48|nr:hypothetical protein [Novosphingobium acidiphilum]